MPIAPTIKKRLVGPSLVAIATLLIGSASSAATVYLPFPYFVDGNLRLASTVHLVADGGAIGLPLDGASGHPNLPASLRPVVRALQENNSGPFVGMADPAAFGSKPNAAAEFFVNISRMFAGMDDRRVAYWIRIDKVGLLVLSGMHQGKKVFPVLAFQSNGADWRAIPGHRGVAFNMLMLWAAGVNLNPNVLTSAPSGSESTASDIRGETLTVSFTKDAYDGSAESERRAVQALKAAAGTESAKAAPAVPRSRFSERSLNYLDKLSHENVRDYLKQLSETEFIGRITLGEASLVYLRHVPSATVGPLYLGGSREARVVTNVGHSSASDTVLTSQENIEFAKRKAGAR